MHHGVCNPIPAGGNQQMMEVTPNVDATWTSQVPGGHFNKMSIPSEAPAPWHPELRVRTLRAFGTSVTSESEGFGAGDEFGDRTSSALQTAGRQRISMALDFREKEGMNTR